MSVEMLLKRYGHHHPDHLSGARKAFAKHREAGAEPVAGERSGVYRRIVRDGGDPRSDRPDDAPGKASPLFEVVARETMATKTERVEGKNVKPMHPKAIEKWRRSVEVYALPFHGRQIHTIYGAGGRRAAAPTVEGDAGRRR